MIVEMLVAPTLLGAASLHLLFLLNFALFCLPGLAVATQLRGRLRCDRIVLTTVIVMTGSVLGYLSFWLFFLSKAAGKGWSFAVIALAVAGIIRAARNGTLLEILSSVRTPFLLAAITGVFYLSLFSLYGDPAGSGAGLANGRFFAEGLPGDNLIPLIFAGKVYAHEAVRPFCCGGWLSSDRPPLQTGIVLFLRPLRPWGSLAVQYQVIGTALQCLWIPAAWALLTSLRIPAVSIRQVLVLLIASPFYFFNSVYVWPKLLAASLVLFAATAMWACCPFLAAACLGLAMLAHPGCVFSIPAFGFGYLIRRPRVSARSFALAFAVLSVLLVPWGAYQKFVDPPGNRLVKMHMAGVFEPDSRSAAHAIADAYLSRPPTEILHNKWLNIRNLIGPQPLDWMPWSVGDFSSRESSRRAQSRYIWNALGFLNLGWMIPAALYISRQFRAAPQSIIRLLGAGIGNLFVWSFLLFGPNATGTPHSSYADIMLIAIASAALLVTLPRVVAAAALLLELWNLLLVWTWLPGRTVVPAFAASGFACLATLVWIFLLDAPEAKGAKLFGRELVPDLCPD